MKYYISKIFFGLSCLFAFTIVLPFKENITSIISILLFICVLLDAILNKENTFFKRSSFKIVAISVYLLFIIGLLYTSNLHDGLVQIQRKIAFIVFPVIYLSKPLSREQLIKVFWFLIVGIMVYITINWLAIYEMYHNDLVLRNRFGYNYVLHSYFRKTQFSIHHAYMGMYIIFALVICLYLIEHYKKLWIRIVLALIILIYLFNFPLIASKVSFVTIVVAVMAYFVFKKSFHYKRFLLLILPLVLVVSGMFILSNDWTEKLLLRSINERLILWKVSIEVIRDNFWFGVGTGDVLDVLNTKYTNPDHHDYYSHNSFLLFFVRLGVLGVFSFLFYHFFLFKKAIKNNNILLFVLVIIALLSSLTEHVYERHIGIVFISFFFSILFCSSNENIKS